MWLLGVGFWNHGRAQAISPAPDTYFSVPSRVFCGAKCSCLHTILSLCPHSSCYLESSLPEYVPVESSANTFSVWMIFLPWSVVWSVCEAVFIGKNQVALTLTIYSFRADLILIALVMEDWSRWGVFWDGIPACLKSAGITALGYHIVF